MSLGYVALRSVVALIRSACPLMFRSFGYRYVREVSARPIREQLANPLSETPVLRGVSWRIDDSLADNSLAEQAQLAIAVAPLRCFLVVLRLYEELSTSRL